MAEHDADTSDQSKTGVQPSSMSSRLPLLVFHHRPNGHGDTNDNDDEMLMFSLSQQSLHKNMEHGLLAAGNNSMCWTTPQGWMLIAEDGGSSPASAYLWNPRTGYKLSLPDITHDIPLCCNCLLSHRDPTAHPECVLVLLHPATPDMWYCRVVVDGDTASGNWSHYTYDIGNYALPEAYRPPTKRVIPSVAAFQGRLYFVNSSRDMCAVEFPIDGRPPVFHYFRVRDVSFPRGMSSGVTWLVASHDDTQLFLICVCFVGFDPDNIGAVLAYKMDFSSSRRRPCCWRKVHDIGDAVVLLEDANMATSCPASPLGLRGNQIYFMKNFRDDDADLCVFDMELNFHEIIRVHQHDNLLLCRKPFWIVPPS